MTQHIIEAHNLSKRYRIHHQGRPDDKLRTALVSGFKKLVRGNTTVGHAEDFWALQDVSFNVKEGEIIGVIGKNGAGKSTLLKILSRITEPTEGEAILRGRVCSLLEVGTGFHPELTGRENIFMNGSILGMSKQEIKTKFDEIIDFAGVKDFLDTPVKRYSSGMYVRLAFSVAAHLDPEILLVDEVLSVGDAAFQRKCLGRMSAVAEGGRTGLFVSHNMGSVRRLCPRALLLNEGELMRNGPVGDIIEEYVRLGTEQAGERVWCCLDEAPGNEVVRIRAVRLRDKTGDISTSYNITEPVSVEI